MRNPKIDVEVVAIKGGIIHLVEPNGIPNMYRQRGIGKIRPDVLDNLIRSGRLDHRVLYVPELPKSYRISCERPDIMGRVRTTFSIKDVG